MARTTEVIYGIPGGGGITVEAVEAISGLLTREKTEGDTCNDVVRRLPGMPPAS